MHSWFGLPRLLRLGLVVIAAGVAGDAVVHLSTPAAAGGFTPAQHGAHLVVLIGMLVTLAGVVLGGRRTRRRGRPTTTGGAGRAAREV